MMTYQWRITGFPVDATEAAEELERIRGSTLEYRGSSR